MKIEIITPSEELFEEMDYRQFIEVKVDGMKYIDCYDGEPEDSNLMRNFSDIFRVGELMKMAYEAGKRGEDFNLNHIEDG